MPLFFEQTLGFDCRHAAGAGRRNRLTVDAVLHVARVKNAVDIGSRAPVRDEVAVRIQIELAPKNLGIRDMTDRDKETVHIAQRGFAGHQIP